MTRTEDQENVAEEMRKGMSKLTKEGQKTWIPQIEEQVKQQITKYEYKTNKERDKKGEDARKCEVAEDQEEHPGGRGTAGKNQTHKRKEKILRERKKAEANERSTRSTRQSKTQELDKSREMKASASRGTFAFIKVKSHTHR